MSPEQAVSRGQFVVNGAVSVVMWGLPGLAALAAFAVTRDAATAGGVAGLAFLACWPFAWLTWSILAPRWRLWAYERVEDLGELKRLAVQGSLIWPDGHLFERTEIRSKAQRKRISEREAAWLKRQADS